MSFRGLLIRVFSGLAWRIRPKRLTQALSEFSHIEKDSGAQLRACIGLTDDNALRGYLFQHVLEEYFHAELFSTAAHKRATQQPMLTIPNRVAMISADADDQEIAEFFAYVHVGEASVNRDFRSYAAASPSKDARRVFLRAGADEGRHEADTLDVLATLTNGDKRAVKKMASSAKWALRRRQFSDAMHGIGKLPLHVMLGLVYAFLV
jgi:hypothetical protein